MDMDDPPNGAIQSGTNRTGLSLESEVEILRFQSALVQFINQQNDKTRSSPLEPAAQWFLPKFRSARTSIAAILWRSETAKSLSDLIQFPICQETVSIDFFDTLVTRHVDPPEFVLRKVAEISVPILNRRFAVAISEEGYLRARLNCQKALRRENLKVFGFDGEAGLPQILERMLSQIGSYDSTLISQLLAAEIHLESEVLSLNSGAKELLNLLKAENKKIVVLSDMYLTSDLLHNLSERLGIREYIDGFYVSGEIGLAKHSGRLFKHVLQERGISANELFHIGDNLQSDFNVPSSLGIPSKWLYQRDQLWRRSRIGRDLRGNPRRFVGRMIDLHATRLYHRSEVLERRLFTNIAPAVFSMAYQSLRACVTLGLERLYFVAREGIALKSVFEFFIHNHPEFEGRNFQLQTLFASRASTVCARIQCSSDVTQLIAMVAERANDFSFRSLLAAWNIDEGNLGYKLDNRPTFSSRKELLDFLLAHPQLQTKIVERIQEDRNNLIGYLQLVGIFDAPCALVDVGWAGTIQRNIDALHMGARLFGMYLGTNEKIEARNLTGHIFSAADYRTGAVHKSAALLETLMSVSEVGTTVRYEARNDEVKPVFRDPERSVASIEPIRERVFKDFYPVFYDLTRKYCMPSSILVEHARRQYFDLVCHPDRSFLEAVKTLRFNFDWGRADAQPLIWKLKLRDLAHPTDVMASLWRCPWLFGVLKASHLGFLNAPISWVLGYEGRVSLRNRKKLRRFLGMAG